MSVPETMEWIMGRECVRGPARLPCLPQSPSSVANNHATHRFVARGLCATSILMSARIYMHTFTHAQMACELGGVVPVCATGTQYRNEACARCNFEDPGNTYPGGCMATPPDTDVVAACAGKSINAQGRWKQQCLFLPVQPVCLGNRNYKNVFCARCNDVPVQPGTTTVPTNFHEGLCSTVHSPRLEPVVGECDGSASALYPYDSLAGLCANFSVPGSLVPACVDVAVRTCHTSLCSTRCCSTAPPPLSLPRFSLPDPPPLA